MAVKSQKQKMREFPLRQGVQKKKKGRVHETGRIPFFILRVSIAGTVAGLARRAVGYTI